MVEKILIIDDQQEVGETLKEWLAKFGYESAYCSRGDEGLAAMAKENFGAILLDIKMPGEDGITVLKKIKALDASAAVILMTAYPSDDTITQALNSGAYDYLLKPFNIEKIQFLIDRAVSYHKFLKGSGKNPKKP
jgi:DNA-binding NtrC family response regulator